MERGNEGEAKRVAWGMRSTENGAANSRFNYSQLFKLHLKWSIWGRLAIKLTNFLFAAVCPTSSLPLLPLPLPLALSLLLPLLLFPSSFEILLLKCCTNFVRFLTGKAWTQTLLVCEHSNNSHTHTRTHPHTLAQLVRTWRHLWKILIASELIKKFLMQIKSV